MTRRSAPLAVCAIALLATASAAQNHGADVEDSVYRRYDRQTDCDRVGGSPPGGPGASAQLVCPGPNGTQLMLSDDDARISLDYATRTQFGPWESFPSFNDIHETVEWRRQPLNGTMQPFATIHRWFVGTQSRQREILVVSTVARRPGQESCMVGYIDTTDTPDANRLARRVADRFAWGFVCGTAGPRPFGWVSLASPVPSRADH